MPGLCVSLSNRISGCCCYQADEGEQTEEHDPHVFTHRRLYLVVPSKAGGGDQQSAVLLRLFDSDTHVAALPGGLFAPPPTAL